MIIKSERFRGQDEVDIYYGLYLPEERMRAVVFFVHGIYETFEIYGNLAMRLARKGIGFVSFDYRGFGKSGGTRGYIRTHTDWIADMDIFFGIVQKEIPENIPLFFLVYSMGSVIGLTYLLARTPRISGLILAGTGNAFSPAILCFCYLARWINKFFPECFLLIPSFSGIIRGRRLPYSSVVKKPAERLYPSIGSELLKCMLYIRKSLNRLRVPVYLQYAEKDFFFRKRIELLDRIEAQDKSFTVYYNCKHDIYKETISVRKKVFRDLVYWVENRI